MNESLKNRFMYNFFRNKKISMNTDKNIPSFNNFKAVDNNPVYNNFLDKSFKSPYGYDFRGTSIILDNGKYLVTGGSVNSNDISQLLIIRYNNNGELDTTFGDPDTQNVGNKKGYLLKTITEGQSCVGFSIILDSGKYVVSGYSTDSNGISQLLIIRYNNNGELDTTFGDPDTQNGDNKKGYLLKTITEGNDCEGHSMLLDNGKYVVSGYSTDSNNIYKLLIIRYNNNGSVDTTFGEPDTQNGGNKKGYLLKTITEGNDCEGYSMLLDNGKYIVTGESLDSNDISQLFIIRYNNDGNLDTTFGESDTQNGGNKKGYILKTIPEGQSCAGTSIILDNGKYVVTGVSDNFNNIAQLLIIRYNNNGELDTTFGDSDTQNVGNKKGYVLKNITEGNNCIGTSIILHNGKYVVTGVDGSPGIQSLNQLFVMRYNNNGELDTTFGSGAGYIINIIDTPCFYVRIILDNDKYVVIGNINMYLLVARYLSSLPIKVNSIKLNISSVTIKTKAKKQLIAKLLPANATNKSIVWKSSNSKIASVIKTGLFTASVTAKAPGKVTITATSVDGAKKAISVISVVQPVTGVKISNKTLKLKVKEKKKLVASVVPANSTNKKIKWISSAPKKASVNISGTVTAISKGTVTITAQSIDGSFKAKTIVTIL
jgi:uncharacterized delta-60 repeat protein